MAAGGVALATAGLAGCGDDDDKPAAGNQPGASGQPVRGGTLKTHGVPGLVLFHLDPHAAAFSQGTFTRPTSNQVVRMDMSSSNADDWKVSPDAAVKWETPDPTTYIFHLADNLKFHNIPPVNGRAATAEDVKYSLERTKRTDPGFTLQAYFKEATIDAIDAKTVRFRTARPLATFWSRITASGMVILAKESIDQSEGGGLIKSGKPIAGTGPFILDEFQPERTFRVKRNPDYFKAGKPYLDEYDARYYADVEPRFVGFKAGQIDITDFTTADQYREAEALPGVTVNNRAGHIGYAVFFNTSRPPFNDARVRRAVSLATPRQETVLLHGGNKVKGLSGPGFLLDEVHGTTATWPLEELKKRPGYRSGADHEKDLAEAKKMLEAAGFSGYKGTFAGIGPAIAPEGATTLTILTETYKKVGLDLTVRGFNYGELQRDMIAGKTYDIALMANTLGGPDYDDAFEVYFSDAGGRRYAGGWHNDEFERLLRLEQGQLNLSERAKTARKIQEFLEDQSPAAAVYDTRNLSAWYNKVQNWYGNPWGIMGTEGNFIDELWLKA